MPRATGLGSPNSCCPAGAERQALGASPVPVATDLRPVNRDVLRVRRIPPGGTGLARGVKVDHRRKFEITGVRLTPGLTAARMLMLTTDSVALRAVPVLLGLALAACGGGQDGGVVDSAGPSATVGATAAGGDATGVAFAFTDADLDAYIRGLRKEIELVKVAKERANAARTPEERGAAAQAEFDVNTIPAAADSIGVPLDRYRATRRTVNRVLETLDFQGKIDGPMELDTARASPEMKQRLATDPFAELPPASATSLRSRLDEASAVWIEYVHLVAVSG